MDVYFLTPKYIEWATRQIFCVPDVKNSLTLSVILSLYYYWIGLKRNLFEDLELPFEQ